MALVKSTDVAFEFPVLTTTAKGEQRLCRELDDLTRGSSVEIKSGRFKNMKMIDSSGRRWIVRSFRKMGRIERRNLFHILFLQAPDWRLRYNLEELTFPSRNPRSSARNESDGTGLGALHAPTGGEMPLVKATDAELRFPILAYIPEGELTGYPDLERLSAYRRKLFKRGIYEGMILIDDNRRRFICRSAYLDDQEYRRRWWWPIWPLLYDGYTYVEFELQEIDRISMDEVIDMVFKAREDDIRLWPRTRRAPPDVRQKDDERLRAAQTVRRIFNILDFYVEPGFWWGRK